MSKSQLNDFLGLRSFDVLKTDTVTGGGVSVKKKEKGGDKEKKIAIKTADNE